MRVQGTLFDAPGFPEGFVYRPELISSGYGHEREDQIASLALWAVPACEELEGPQGRGLRWLAATEVAR